MKPAHRRGAFNPRDNATRIRAWTANPDTRCWRCGRTRAEHGRAWTNGHLRDGDPTSPLLPECEPCNYSAGGRLGARRRNGVTRPTRDWLAT